MKQSQDRDFTSNAPTCPQKAPIFFSLVRDRFRTAAQPAKLEGTSTTTMEALVPKATFQGKYGHQPLLLLPDFFGRLFLDDFDVNHLFDLSRSLDFFFFLAIADF